MFTKDTSLGASPAISPNPFDLGGMPLDCPLSPQTSNNEVCPQKVYSKCGSDNTVKEYKGVKTGNLKQNL